jgi:hypothetical protein
VQQNNFRSFNFCRYKGGVACVFAWLPFDQQCWLCPAMERAMWKARYDVLRQLDAAELHAATIKNFFDREFTVLQSTLRKVRKTVKRTFSARCEAPPQPDVDAVLDAASCKRPRFTVQPVNCEDAAMFTAESNDAAMFTAESNDAETGDAESNDAETGDDESNDAETGDAESNDAESNDAESAGGRAASSLSTRRLRAGSPVYKDLTPAGNRWREMYKQLKTYMAQHGGSVPPRHCLKYKSLSSWVCRQRRARRNMVIRKMGQKPATRHCITAEKIAELDRIGFIWTCDMSTRHWDKMYRDLYAFVTQHQQAALRQNTAAWTQRQVALTPALFAWVRHEAVEFWNGNRNDPGRWERRMQRLKGLGVQFGPLTGTFKWSLPQPSSGSVTVSPGTAACGSGSSLHMLPPPQSTEDEQDEDEDEQDEDEDEQDEDEDEQDEDEQDEDEQDEE